MKPRAAAPLDRPVTLRPVQPADAPAMERYVTALDAASRRLRFHGAVNGCCAGLLRRLTQADGVRHVAFVALCDGQVVGEARYVLGDGQDGDDPAEFAISVAEAVRGRGVADALLQALLQAAGSARVGELRGDVLEGNHRMAAFMRRHGFELDAFADTDAGVQRWQRRVPRPARIGSAPWAVPSAAAARPAAARWSPVHAVQRWWHATALGRAFGVAAVPQMNL